jgi:hypothetical protein
MSESDDLLEKADAFLKRYRASGGPGREEVPVLTEVVADTDAKAGPPSSGGPTSGNPAKAESNELEQRLRQSILNALSAQIASSLEEALRIRLEDHLQRKLADLSTQIKADLEVQVRDAVKRAVDLEIARRRGSSRKT